MLIIKAKNWDELLSLHFSLKEFRCRCEFEACQSTKVDSELVSLLEEIRDMLGSSIKITSGYRCEDHNDDVQGSVKNSYHTKGMAADILVPNHFHKAITDRYAGRLGIGFYDNRLHVDVRKGCARWGKIPKGDSNV